MVKTRDELIEAVNKTFPCFAAVGPGQVVDFLMEELKVGAAHLSLKAAPDKAAYKVHHLKQILDMTTDLLNHNYDVVLVVGVRDEPHGVTFLTGIPQQWNAMVAADEDFRHKLLATVQESLESRADDLDQHPENRQTSKTVEDAERRMLRPIDGEEL